jgi:hypothetical protein
MYVHSLAGKLLYSGIVIEAIYFLVVKEACNISQSLRYLWRMRTLSFLLLLFVLPESLSARLPDLIPYRKGNLWGYCDSTKKIVIESQWEMTTPFLQGRAVVKYNGLFGLINSAGNTTTGFIYEEIEQEVRNGKRIAKLKRKKYGLINSDGDVIIPFSYSRIYWESDKYLRVYNGASGEIDSSGRVIIPVVYASTYPEQGYLYGESATCGYFVFSNGSGYKFGVIDSTGFVVVPFIYSMVVDLGNGYFSVGRSTPDSTYNYTEYIYDRSGTQVTWKEVPPAPALNITYFPYPFRDSSMNVYYLGWASDMYYRNLIHSDTLLIAGYFHQGLARYMTLDSLCGFKNEKFESVIPAQFGFCSDFDTNSLASVYALHHKYAKRRNWKDKRRDPFDVDHRKLIGYIDVFGTQYWED